MHAHGTSGVSAVLLLTGLVTASCSDVTPVDPTAPSAAHAITLRAEPERVEPVFLPPLGGCPDGRPFQTSFVVIIGGSVGFIVQELGVSFSDQTGIVTVPTVLSTTSRFGGSMQASLPPIPLPTSAPIPIPVTGPNNGLSLTAGASAQMPVTLEFGCHVRPRGTIVVTAGTRDDRGRRDERRLTIDMGH